MKYSLDIFLDPPTLIPLGIRHSLRYDITSLEDCRVIKELSLA